MAKKKTFADVARERQKAVTDRIRSAVRGRQSALTPANRRQRLGEFRRAYREAQQANPRDRLAGRQAANALQGRANQAEQVRRAQAAAARPAQQRAAEAAGRAAAARAVGSGATVRLAAIEAARASFAAGGAGVVQWVGPRGGKHEVRASRDRSGAQVISYRAGGGNG